MEEYPGTTDQTTGGDDTGSAVKEQVKQQTQQVAQQTQQVAGQAVDQARQKGTTMLAGQKDRAADSLGSVTQALQQTSQTLRDQDQAGIGNVIDQVAQRLESFGTYLRQKDVNELIGQGEDFARRNPPVFLGGALVLGMLAARFLKSSAPSSSGGPRGYYPRSSYSPNDYGYSPSPSTRYGYETSPSGGYGYETVPTGYDSSNRAVYGSKDPGGSSFASTDLESDLPGSEVGLRSSDGL